MSVPYKNPISGLFVSSPSSVQRNQVYGTNFSTLQVGGYMEVYNLSRDERKRRGELGRQYGLGYGHFTAEHMCNSFVEHIDKSIELWTPRKKFELVKA
jgi:hypothetical protein